MRNHMATEAGQDEYIDYASCRAGDDCGRQGNAAEPLPPQKDYFVSATLQILVADENLTGALLQVKELLNELIATSKYHHDPMNGATIDAVEVFD